MSNPVAVEEISSQIIIRFDRPEIRSPLSIDVLDELARILTNIEGRSDIRHVIFTGVDKVFASGADLREIAEVDRDGAREFALRGQSLMNRISGLSVPTTAAVNGICFGGALDLALACRSRIASPDAVFSHPGANLGIITGWGGTQRLPRLVGEAKALQIFLTSARLTANEALDCGLVDEIGEDALARALGKY